MEIIIAKDEENDELNKKEFKEESIEAEKHQAAAPSKFEPVSTKPKKVTLGKWSKPEKKSSDVTVRIDVNQGNQADTAPNEFEKMKTSDLGGPLVEEKKEVKAESPKNENTKLVIHVPIADKPKRVKKAPKKKKSKSKSEFDTFLESMNRFDSFKTKFDSNSVDDNDMDSIDDFDKKIAMGKMHLSGVDKIKLPSEDDSFI